MLADSPLRADPRAFLVQEAESLLTRLERVEPFAIRETSVPAAALAFEAQTAIERYLAMERRKLAGRLHAYLRWLRGPQSGDVSPAEWQRRFTILRLQFVAMLGQFNIFSDVMTQRSEHETGVWLAGLDVAAADALNLPGGFYKVPPVACYLAPGHGAAIRRAFTPLPGGGDNPLAIIRVPRERMVGSGVASSLVHEVGHQGAALLHLANSLRPVLSGLRRQGDRSQQLVWGFWGRWISEIVADFWAVARLGVGATIGLLSVVSLPKFFVFRISADDLHPPPVVRVLLSCAMGNALYPDPQWAAIARLWEAVYPPVDLHPEKRRILGLVIASIPGFVSVLINHRPRSLRGRSIAEVLSNGRIRPSRLREDYRQWIADPRLLRRASPTRAFAVIGQAKADGKMTPRAESQLLDKLLRGWALEATLTRTAVQIMPVRLLDRVPT
jgi:hypothetical protein